MEITYNPVIPLLDIYPKKMKTLTSKDIRTPLYIAALFTIAKIWKPPKQSSIDERIKKMLCVCVRARVRIMKYYSAIKRNEILPFVTTWVDLDGIMLSEINQRKTNTMISLLCGLKNK